MFLSFIVKLLSKIFFFTGRMGHISVFAKPLSAEEERECFKKLKEGDKSQEEKLIKHNLRLVAHIVKKYNFSRLEREELISVGSIGLLKAVKSFDIEKGHSFSTYAARCIQNEILMLIRSEKKYQSEVSLEDKVKTDKDGNEVSLIDVLEDPKEHIAETAESKVIFDKLIGIIEKTLSPREREVIYMRYGINGYTPKTQNEVAAILGISRSYISRIEKQALSSIRTHSKELL